MAPRDEAPRVVAADLKSEDVAQRVEKALLNVPQNIRRLAAKVPPAKVEQLRPGSTSGYDSARNTLLFDPQADAPEIIHEYFHHIDYSLAIAPETCVSKDAGTIIGRELRAEIDRLGMLGEEGRAALEQRMPRDLYVEDLIGALSFNKVSAIRIGHPMAYWQADPDRRYREAFANLGTLYSTDRWGKVKAVLPALADAFERWLDAALDEE